MADSSQSDARSTTICRFENADGQWWEIDMDPNERTVRYPLPEGVVLTRNATSLELHLVDTLANTTRGAWHG